MSSQIMVGRFEGRTAIVTGGAQGIGKEITRRLATEGGSVVIADINPEVGIAAARDLSDTGLKVSYEQVDVAVMRLARNSWWIGLLHCSGVSISLLTTPALLAKSEPL